jgi:Tfp pilus assembly protein PilV
MIRTILNRRRMRQSSQPTANPAGNGPLRLAAESGDTLIEVLISALVIVLVVVATLSGLNNANHATSLDRERSQADALAQQDEDQLHSEPVAKLSELSETHEVLAQEVTTGGTRYKIESTAQYKVDSTGTASCTSSTAKADYIETTSTVSWPGITKKSYVVETGIVSPPADSALIVQVLGASGEAVPKMTVEASGPSTITTETSADGCAILAVNPGEYSLNVHRAGYVDQYGYTESSKDPHYSSSFYVIAESTAKRSFQFAPAGAIEAKFTGANSEGDVFVAFNALTTIKEFGKFEYYHATENTGAILFPFASKYTVYSGTCEADLPTSNGQESNPEVEVKPGATSVVNVPVAAINIGVNSGTKAAPGTSLSSFTGTLEDTGCKTVRKFTATTGVLPQPGMPFGTYSLCVTATVSGKPRKYSTAVLNNKATGVSVPTIYLGEGEEKAGCP